ncbi:MAG: methionine--tRNA ligase [Woeseia sp.]|nr:MAG: methionine--tRNA ligase [Woeseia sp.]
MNKEKKKLLVTNALPYANGPIHIGHLVGYIQADIWVRFKKMKQRDVVYLCASDAHGAPIMLSAEELSVEPKDLAAEYTKQHAKDFADFFIEFDNYHTTHSKENEELVNEIFANLKESDCIEKRTIEQAYDEQESMFLPDRYVRGTCPQCKSLDQYGDSCEKCGATYKPTDLIDPKSVLSGKAPVLRESEHYFMKLGKFESFLKDWLGGIELHESVRSKLQEWFEIGLKDWDISRDHPYFGFKIPGEDEKYFYVWLDAPIGYLASLKHLSERDSKINYDDYFSEKNESELVHFIGKDIIYFHALFWPAVLEGAGLKKPDAIYVNGFLTVNGEKMSKSRGTFIKARSYLEHNNPEYLRYYFAYKTSPGIDDFDLDTKDFLNRVNSDLVGKWINIASRSSKFLNQQFGNKLGENVDESLLENFESSSDEISDLYDRKEFGQAMRKIMLLADQANQYLDQEKPWVLIKDEENKERVLKVCTTSINLFFKIMVMLKPVVPSIAKNGEGFLNLEHTDWDSINTRLLNHQISDYKPLLTRIENENIEAMLG